MSKKGTADLEKVEPTIGQTPDWMRKEKVEAPRDDSSILPSIKVIQAVSPEMDPDGEKYVEGILPGDLLITVSPPVIVRGKAIKFIPFAVRKRWAEFNPRNSGGGFVASYWSREEMEEGYTQGNDIQPTIEYLVSVENIETPVILGFNGPSKMPVARRMADLVEQAAVPLHGGLYSLSSARAKNKKNQSYFNFSISFLSYVDKETFEMFENRESDSETKRDRKSVV